VYTNNMGNRQTSCCPQTWTATPANTPTRPEAPEHDGAKWSGLPPITVFDFESLRGLLLQVLALSVKRLPGSTDEERKRFCVDFLVTQVEKLDNLVPAIASFLDLPVVDALERTLIEMFVDRVYDRVVQQTGNVADAESHVSAAVDPQKPETS
jgi:hypothetical protein